MFSKKDFLLCLSLSSITGIAFSDEVQLSKQYSVCLDKSGGVTSEMLDCNGTELNRQDARLNKAYKEVVRQLSPARKKQLQNAQRAWLKYRDANCDFYADPDGGTAATLNTSSCFLNSTASRAEEIEGFKE